jgi:hypothetical protein
MTSGVSRRRGEPPLRGALRSTDCRSAAASASHQLSKSQRSRARSGRLHGRVRHAGLSFRGATRLRRPPLHGTTWHDGPPLEPHPAPNHALHDGRWLRITRRTRSRSPRRAFSITSHRTTSAQRAVSITSRRTTPAQRASARKSLARRAFGITPDEEPRKECRPRAPAAERSAHQPRRNR